MTPKTNVRLSDAQRKQVYQEYLHRKNAGHQFTNADIAKWAKERFSLKNSPHHSTISLIIKQCGAEKKITGRKFQSKKLEDNLSNWIWKMYYKNIFISDAMIIEKGKFILSELNSQLDEQNKILLSFSNGWLNKFKKRHGFKRCYSHGESANLDVKRILKELPEIGKKLSAYALNDIFNADEFGFSTECHLILLWVLQDCLATKRQRSE